MTDKIYVLIAFGGSYEDAWEHNRVASFDREGLEIVKAEEEERIDALKVWQQHRLQFSNDWNAANPRPDLGPRPDDKQWPSFAGLKESEITAEMRQDRQRIKGENHAAIEAYLTPERKRYDAWSAAMDNYDTDHGRIKSDSDDTDVCYRIDEVAFVAR